jgi:N-acetylmuramoyl-L-alanine amidase
MTCMTRTAGSRHRALSVLTGAALVGVVCLAVSACGSSAPAAARPARLTIGRAQAARPRARHAAERVTKGLLAGRTVGIDPGHNGRNYTDPSYIDRQIWNGREHENCNTTGTATDGGYAEARFTFRVATFLRRDLRAEGARVVMTRPNNHGVGPCVNKRAEIINHAHATVGIDIHGDGGPASGRGFTILEPVKDKENRHVIAKAATFGRVLRRAVLAGTTMPTSTYDGHNGVNHRDDLAGLNLTKVPLVLIECGNMRNATDARLMTSTRFQKQLAAAFAKAITTFARRR